MHTPKTKKEGWRKASSFSVSFAQNIRQGQPPKEMAMANSPRVGNMVKSGVVKVSGFLEKIGGSG